MTLPTDAKARKEMAMWTYLTEYFPDSLEAEVMVSVVGNRQHNPGEKLHWSRGKSTDQMDTAFRHMWDHKTVGPRDVDGCYHLAKAIWRLKAELQLTIEAERAQNSCGGSLVGDMPNVNHTHQAFAQGTAAQEIGSAAGSEDPAS